MLNHATNHTQQRYLQAQKTTLMKHKLLILLFTIFSSICFGQINPEDIIVVYDSLNPSGKVILKSELTSDLDSLSIHLVDEKRNELLTKKDSLTIKNLLTGKWKLESTKRINGKSFNLQSYEQLTFNENQNFIQVLEGKTTQGKWFLETKTNGNLRLKYNEPQFSITNKELLKHLPEEQLKALSFDSNTLSIMEINEELLIFATFIHENVGQIDDMFYRLILMTYRKDE